MIEKTSITGNNLLTINLYNIHLNFLSFFLLQHSCMCQLSGELPKLSARESVDCIGGKELTREAIDTRELFAKGCRLVAGEFGRGGEEALSESESLRRSSIAPSI
eukprot:GILJ01007032.1.p2 GENE.GILJ01007032.1~~GILJ01007032.1.p2  ORF type:complete len:105 (-),score=0.67 GILJ01007032.1:566-880(-)